MLQTLLQMIVIAVIFIAWGLPVIYYQQRITGTKFSVSPGSMLFSFFAGTCILALLASVLCLFVPLRSSLLLILTAILIAIETWFILKHRLAGTAMLKTALYWFRSLSLLEKIFLLSVILMLLLLGSLRSLMQDQGLYHLQIIQWTHQFPAVPGLGNLYLRNGFFSNWLHLISWTSPMKLQPSNYLALNASLSIGFFIFLFERFRRLRASGTAIARSMSIFYFFSLLFALLEWDLLRAGANTTSYDFIVTVLSFVAISLMFENLLRNGNPQPDDEILIILFSTAIPFFKLSGLFILPVTFTYFALTKKPFKYWLITALLIIAGCIPMLAKNYIQTGYPLYPYTFLKLGSPDWMIPEPMVKNISGIISLSNKHIDLFEEPGLVPAVATLQWIPKWFAMQSLVDKLLCALFPFIALASFIYLSQKRIGLRKKILPLYTVIILILVAWFLVAPDQRFVYAYFSFACLLVPAFILAGFITPTIQKLVLIIFAIFCIAYSIQKGKSLDAEVSIFIRPQDTKTPSFTRLQSGNGYYHIPSIIDDNWNPRCFDLRLPCIYHRNPYLEWRGKTPGEGFRMKPFNDPVFIRTFIY